MVDYTSRSGGVGARGILITLAVIAVILVVLAIVGTTSVPTGEEDVIAPSAIEADPAVPVVIE